MKSRESLEIKDAHLVDWYLWDILDLFFCFLRDKDPVFLRKVFRLEPSAHALVILFLEPLDPKGFVDRSSVAFSLLIESQLPVADSYP
jgi:hypothetical protein